MFVSFSFKSDKCPNSFSHFNGKLYPSKYPSKVLYILHKVLFWPLYYYALERRFAVLLGLALLRAAIGFHHDPTPSA